MDEYWKRTILIGEVSVKIMQIKSTVPYSSCITPISTELYSPYNSNSNDKRQRNVHYTIHIDDIFRNCTFNTKLQSIISLRCAFFPGHETFLSNRNILHAIFVPWQKCRLNSSWWCLKIQQCGYGCYEDGLWNEHTHTWEREKKLENVHMIHSQKIETRPNDVFGIINDAKTVLRM